MNMGEFGASSTLSKPSIEIIYRGLWLLICSLTFLLPNSTLRAQYDGSLCGEEGYLFGGLAWSPDGEMLAVGTTAGIVLHHTSDLSISGRFAETVCVTTLSWRSDSPQLAVGTHEGLGNGGHVEIWDSESMTLVTGFGSLAPFPFSIAWSPNGEMLVGDTFNNQLQLWNSNGQSLYEFQQEAYFSASQLAWSPDSQFFATVLFSVGDPRLTIWNTVQQDVAFQYEWPFFSGGQIAWSPDGEHLATNGSNYIYVFEADATQEYAIFYAFYAGRFSSVRSLVWRPDSSQIATVIRSSDETYRLQVWDVATGEVVVNIPNVFVTGDSFYFNALAYSPDGTRLASISDDGKVYIWDATTWETLAVSDDYRSMLLPGVNYLESN